MYAIDFEYDGRYLSDYGYIVCNFNYSNGSVSADAGSKINFSKVSRSSGKQFSLTNTEYDECISTTFDICKDPDMYDNYEDRQINNNEYRDLMRWLNRREFLKFRIFDEDDNGRNDCYYNASFNVSKIKIAEKLYGLQLTMESDKPFGYGKERSFTLDFSDISTPKVLRDMSDEIGYVYPDMIITCRQSGDLSIFNELEHCTTIIKNCSAEETITIKGKEQIILSSSDNHDICNDFNYEFFKIGNTMNDRNNKISVSIPCNITIKYSPIIKDAP